MEGWMVLVLTLVMTIMVLAYLFSSGDGIKRCPKCKNPMIKDKIDKGKVWICRKCGHIKQKIKY